MSIEEWDIQYKQLCRRYRRRHDSGECVSYYEYFAHYEYPCVVEALKGIRKENKYFPTPLEIEKAYQIVYGSFQREKKERVECKYCDNVGFFFFSVAESPYKYCQPCAYCQKRSTMRQVVVKKGVPYWAYKEVSKTERGEPIYEASLNRLVELSGSAG